MRRFLLVSSLLVSIASISGCGEKTPEAPAPNAAPTTTVKPDIEAAKTEAPAGELAEAKTAPPPDELPPEPAATEVEEAKVEEAKVEEAPPVEPAPPPAEFTVVDSPTLAAIPALPLHGKVKGKVFDTATVSVAYSSDAWSLEVSFADKQFFKVMLTEDATEPQAGYTLRKEKACCWGYLHHVPEGETRSTSLNAPNGFVVEVTDWDVRPYDIAGPMTQEAGVLKGRLAVVYDGESWVAGTFEAPFKYFGPPPHAAQVIKQRQAEEAKEAAAAWTELAPPADVVIEVGAKVWAAARDRERWTFGEFTIAAIDDKLITLKGGAKTAPGLIRHVPVATDLKGNAFAIPVDHIGPQFAKITTTSGPLVAVRYIGPTGKMRDNEIDPADFVTRATKADAPGLPPVVFFTDANGRRDDGYAIAKTADGQIAVMISSAIKSEIIKVPEDQLVYIDTTKALKRGQKVEAVAGCGMTSYIPRAGKIVEVIEGGIGYRVDTEPCKGAILTRERLRPL